MFFFDIYETAMLGLDSSCAMGYLRSEFEQKGLKMLFDPNWQKPADIKLEPWQEILLKAADLIEQKGWVQGAMEYHGRHCLVGAMIVAAKKDHPLRHGDIGIAVTKMCSAVNVYSARDRQGRSGGFLKKWNDTTGRTKEEVIAKLREVAHGG